MGRAEYHRRSQLAGLGTGRRASGCDPGPGVPHTCRVERRCCCFQGASDSRLEELVFETADAAHAAAVVVVAVVVVVVAAVMVVAVVVVVVVVVAVVVVVLHCACKTNFTKLRAR